MGEVTVDGAGADLERARKIFGPADRAGAHLMDKTKQTFGATHRDHDPWQDRLTRSTPKASGASLPRPAGAL